jgi:4-hydroxy-tetrahydrodipicolinate synthase
MTEIGRVLTAMVTPFDAEGNVDYEQAKRLAVALLDSGSEGLVVTGTTGESPTLTNEEKLRLYEAVRSAIGNRGAIIGGTTNYSTAESIELSREAEHAGVDGLLLTVPYYNKPPQEGLYRHFRAIAEATSLPCILYNVPSRTSLNMTFETTLRLAEIPNIIGIKEASSDLVQIARVIDGAPEGFRVWSGNDDEILPILAMGGYGVVSVAAHLVGSQIQDMVRAYLDGRVEEAGALHRRLLPIFKVLFVVSNPIPVKHALNQVGFRVGPPRLPLCEPDEAAAKQIMSVVSRYRIDIPVGVS